jgi:hypothetical protein
MELFQLRLLNARKSKYTKDADWEKIKRLVYFSGETDPAKLLLIGETSILKLYLISRGRRNRKNSVVKLIITC